MRGATTIDHRDFFTKAFHELWPGGMRDAAEEVGYMTREVNYPNFSAQAECAELRLTISSKHITKLVLAT